MRMLHFQSCESRLLSKLMLIIIATNMKVWLVYSETRLSKQTGWELLMTLFLAQNIQC